MRAASSRSRNGRSATSSPSRATAIRRSTSARLSSFGSGRDRRGPSTASVGSSPPPSLRVEELVKLTDRRQAARQRRGAQLLRAAGRQERAYVSGVGG